MEYAFKHYSAVTLDRKLIKRNVFINFAINFLNHCSKQRTAHVVFVAETFFATQRCHLSFDILREQFALPFYNF